MRLDYLAAAAAAVGAVGAVGNETGFTIAQVRGGLKLKIGIIDLVHALRKYGVEPSQNMTTAENVARKQHGKQGHVTAVPGQSDFEYLSPVHISGQTLHLDFDTGSSDLWVFSTQQPAGARRGHTAFRCDAPHVKGAHWSIRYGDGSTASGIVKRSRVTIGGITAETQAVECAKHVASQFSSNTAIDGVLGFGFDNINNVRPHRAATWFENIRHKLRAPVFTVTLRHGKPGTYDFGFIDASKHKGKIHYAKVNTHRGYWEVASQGYSIGNGKHVPHKFSAILDTGTSLILTSDAIAVKYWHHVNGAQYNSAVGGIIFPCGSRLPDFNVEIGGHKHTVPGHFMDYSIAGTVDGRKYCFGGIQSNGGLAFTILGDIFLKSQFAVFDSRGPKVGLAQQR